MFLKGGVSAYNVQGDQLNSGLNSVLVKKEFFNDEAIDARGYDISISAWKCISNRWKFRFSRLKAEIDLSAKIQI